MSNGMPAGTGGERNTLDMQPEFYHGKKMLTLNIPQN